MSDLPGFYCPYGFPNDGKTCCGGYCGMDAEKRPVKPQPLTLSDLAFLAVLHATVMREGYSETAIATAEKARTFFGGKG